MLFLLLPFVQHYCGIIRVYVLFIRQDTALSLCSFRNGVPSTEHTSFSFTFPVSGVSPCVQISPRPNALMLPDFLTLPLSFLEEERAYCCCCTIIYFFAFSSNFAPAGNTFTAGGGRQKISTNTLGNHYGRTPARVGTYKNCSYF